MNAFDLKEIYEVDGMLPILLGLVDPSMVFIKNEPHPKRKVLKGAYRCINPVSLVDQLVEDVLFSESALLLKEGFFDNGSAVGIGFTDEMNQ